MKKYIKTTVPHGVTPDGLTGPFTPTTVTVDVQEVDGTIVEKVLDVIGVKGIRGLYVDLQTAGAETECCEKIIAVQNRSVCDDGSGGSTVVDPTP